MTTMDLIILSGAVVAGGSPHLACDPSLRRPQPVGQ